MNFQFSVCRPNQHIIILKMKKKNETKTKNYLFVFIYFMSYCFQLCPFVFVRLGLCIISNFTVSKIKSNFRQLLAGMLNIIKRSLICITTVSYAERWNGKSLKLFGRLAWVPQSIVFHCYDHMSASTSFQFSTNSFSYISANLSIQKLAFSSVYFSVSSPHYYMNVLVTNIYEHMRQQPHLIKK